MRVRRQFANALLGSIVTLVALPLGLGPFIGGWIAGRGTDDPTTGGLVGGLAGLVGTLPWAALVYLATSGTIEPIGYHQGGVHVGINTASPGALVLWQEVGLTVLVTATLVAIAVAGGVVGGLREDVLGEIREELSGAV